MTRPLAFESSVWMPRRPGAAAAALALNVALGLALFLSFRIQGALDSSDSVSTLIWLPLPAARPERAKPRELKRPRALPRNPRASVESLAPIMPSTAPIAAPRARAPVDWWAEAERVVRDRLRSAEQASAPSGRIDLHIGSRVDAPAHYAGESYRDELGGKIVWVSGKCYIESDPPLPGTPPVLAATRGTRTVCPGASSAPRGDLFKDLPAYRKYRPE
ncbi:MAG: hypothetical protein ACREUT_02905 [Steroidobacteraceae bacterium]